MTRPPDDFAHRFELAATQAGIAPGRARTARIASLFGVTRETARLWRQGRMPAIATLREIASTLGVSFDWLATGGGSTPRTRGVAEEPASYALADPIERRLIAAVRRLSPKRQRALLAVLADD